MKMRKSLNIRKPKLFGVMHIISLTMSIFISGMSFSVSASSFPLPRKFSVLELNKQLPQEISQDRTCIRGAKSFAVTGELAREMWHAVIPNSIIEDVSVEVDSFDSVVTGVTFWVRGLRYPELIAQLKSRYGLPKFKETEETSDFPRWHERTWKDQKISLIHSVDPENLEWDLAAQTSFVTLSIKNKRHKVQCKKPALAKALDNSENLIETLKESPFYEKITAAYNSGNKKLGAEWLAKGLEAKDAWSQYLMAFYSSSGEYGILSNKDALKWHRLAAAQGHWQSSFDLGLAYEEGAGVEKDLHESLKWYQRAVKQNFPGNDAKDAVQRLLKRSE